MIDTLPYTIPSSSIPVSFRVITITKVKEYQYESAPSQLISIDDIMTIKKDKLDSIDKLIEKTMEEKGFDGLNAICYQDIRDNGVGDNKGFIKSQFGKLCGKC